MYWCDAHPLPSADEFVTPQSIDDILHYAHLDRFYYEIPYTQVVNRFDTDIGDPTPGTALDETFCADCYEEIHDLSPREYDELLSAALELAEWAYCLEHGEAIPRHILPLPPNTMPRPCIHLMPKDTHSGW